MTVFADSKNEFLVVGLMSGTSLDGVDIALCRIKKTNSTKWNYSIEKAVTVQYSPLWKNKLLDAETVPGLHLIQLHKIYGTYLGELVTDFLKDIKEIPDFISSHGHTIFHQPENQFTFQLGDGAYIAAKTGITTISDFRNLDVALGGQGAPLVPIGDRYLFGEFDQCLNLGGFANISFQSSDLRMAFDICPVNIVLNYLSLKYFQSEYDKDGEFGKKGKVDTPLLERLNKLDYFNELPPKSLGKEWVVKNMIPVIEDANISATDKLRTVYENISIQLAKTINSVSGEKVLITGGGAYNKYLLELLQKKINKKYEIPDEKVINYKEALVFAFLGVLRYLNLPNCLCSVTGAAKDNTGGVIHIQKYL